MSREEELEMELQDERLYKIIDEFQQFGGLNEDFFSVAKKKLESKESRTDVGQSTIMKYLTPNQTDTKPSNQGTPRFNPLQKDRLQQKLDFTQEHMQEDFEHRDFTFVPCKQLSKNQVGVIDSQEDSFLNAQLDQLALSLDYDTYSS